MKGATCASIRGTSGISSFNPRPHEGGDTIGNPCVGGDIVSIHAPMKGATSRPGNREHASDVSIHAPMKGATSHPAEEVIK